MNTETELVSDANRLFTCVKRFDTKTLLLKTKATYIVIAGLFTETENPLFEEVVCSGGPGQV